MVRCHQDVDLQRRQPKNARKACSFEVAGQQYGVARVPKQEHQASCVVLGAIGGLVGGTVGAWLGLLIYRSSVLPSGPNLVLFGAFVASGLVLGALLLAWFVVGADRRG
jgi:hypothetical protein